MNFGFAMVRRRSPQVLDFGLAKKAVRQALWIEYLFWNNRKSKACPEPCRRILKWAGIFAIAIEITVCGAKTEAQQQEKIPRIAFVSGTGETKRPGPFVHAFQQGLRELGYVEGKNILVEYRFVEGNRDKIANFMAELAQLAFDAVVTSEQSWVRAVKQANNATPTIMVINGDPVASGLVDSLARPGGNITGLTRLNRELSGKRLELLKEVVPKTSRVGVLTVVDAKTVGDALKEYRAAARALKISIRALPVQGPDPDLDEAFQEANKSRVSGVIIVRSSVLNRYSQIIADLAKKSRLPSMYERSDDVDTGGLISYSANDAESFKRAAVYVDKILKGAKPADLPVEQPTKFELVINLKTAKQIGLTIPPNVLARADRVIK
jgi:putative ABC transport system substrate-binding protein